MNREKIIFLDIDGTLNRLYKIGSPDFEPQCVAAFNRIIEATAASIVLSSSWRYKVHQGHCTLDGLATLLNGTGGIAGSLIGITRPDIDAEHEPRWTQIRDWLHDNPTPRYVILDDDREAFGGRPGILVSARSGLTEADADLAIEILNG